jgi:hypothetical protein
VLVPVRLLQLRSSHPAIVRARIMGLVRMGRVTIAAPAGGAFGTWAGTHRGALVAAQRLRMGPPIRALDWGRWRERLAPGTAGGVPLGQTPS